MISHRTILSILTSLMVMSTAMPSSVLAGPLLGGYGGPGEGNQAILGSALLNGPRGRAGAGLAGASGSAASVRVASRGSQAPVHPGDGKQTAGAIGQASGGPSSPYPVSERGGAAQLAVADSGTLGLSGADLLYVLLALCVLAFTAGLTKRLTRITAA
jgi:hypothetical protein